MLSVIALSVIHSNNAECRFVECHYAEYHYAECHNAECHYAECRGAQFIMPTKSIFFKIFCFNEQICSLELCRMVKTHNEL
jgi:hypothetical protein